MWNNTPARRGNATGRVSAGGEMKGMMMASLMQNLGLEVGSVVVQYDYVDRCEARGVVVSMSNAYHAGRDQDVTLVLVRWDYDSSVETSHLLDGITAIAGRTEYFVA
jgi:hypothetical protein